MNIIKFNFSKASLTVAIESIWFLETYARILNYLLQKTQTITDEYISRDAYIILKQRTHYINLTGSFLEGIESQKTLEHGLHNLNKKELREVFNYLTKEFSKIKGITVSQDSEGINIRFRLIPNEQNKELINIKPEEKMTDLTLCKKLIQLSESAKKRNIAFDISFAKLKRLWSLKKCQITGIEFDHTPGESKSNSKSIDRWNNEEGYIDSNIIICTEHINKLKANLTLLEIKALSEMLTKRKITP